MNTTPTLKCDQEKRTGNIESTVWKHTMESILHGIQTEYRNYKICLLMPE